MNLISSGTSPLWLIVAAMALSLVPIAVGLTTSYLKISIVLGMLKQGLGAQQMPGNLVVMAISMALSLIVMGPVIEKCGENLQANLPKKFDGMPTAENLTMLKGALAPWSEFLNLHAGDREKVFVATLKPAVKVEEKVNPETDKKAESDKEELGFGLLLAFMLTELKEAFSMGFVLLLPFLVIDLVVSNILVGLGMFMVTPAMITLPLKLIVFVMCDGWMLLSKGLVISYGTGNF
jgi:type III secretion protein R